MKVLIAIIAVIVIASIFGYLIQGKKEPKKRVINYNKNPESFLDIVKKAFPNHIVTEKNNTIMICEINHRNEREELVFIRKGNIKNIRKSGKMVIADYEKIPSISELKKDLSQYVK